ncbi:Ca2+-binding RTX toxin-like protein [Amaricoccus macauensis]|uniref:Ca2+-binding RTX toxin-like protein n=1 Tax=Amaricoccus macauensis TaxID=57001 RepID=A0A840SLU9_9RHOB|nr:Ca2+-binding RTX toxin-like protein [Amaricoccus macauensis]
MANYVLTTGNDNFAGTPGTDSFDGISSDGTPGESGGIDVLSGGAGNDDFFLASRYGDGGTIDGGADFDRVYLSGDSFGNIAFSNVEQLFVESSEVALQLGQLTAFSSLTLVPGGNIYLTGAGGTINFAGMVTGTTGIRISASTLTSGHTVTGTDQADSFTNTRYNDVVYGNGGDDRFVGVYQDTLSGGTDQLYGGGGADTFEVRRQNGTIDGGAGTDTVIAQAFQLYPWSPYRGPGDLGDLSFTNVEKLVINSWSVTFATVGQLNSFAQITGGDDTGQIMFRLQGSGGTIDFSSKLALANERVWVYAANATSAVNVSGTANADTLAGSEHADTLKGGLGDDELGGGDGTNDGTDLMNGGVGNDEYTADLTDKLIDSGGIDTIFSAGTFDLRRSARLQGDFENLTLYNGIAGGWDSNGYGNALANVLTGTNGSNVLDGRGGADQMIGREGDDTYVVDTIGDKVVEPETGNGGHDTVQSRISFDFTNPDQAIGGIEDLVLTGTGAIRGAGNALDNAITGNTGANLLDGRGGADTMTGGAGNDRYVVDNVGDQVVESAGQGIDRVSSTITFSLESAQVEHLTLQGSADINGTGNDFANALNGNSGANVLVGNGGDDSLSGGLGNDTLDGGDGADVLNGGAGNDFLNGGLGADILIGGAGQDIFRFNTALGTTDTLTGFKAADDTIEIDNAIMTALTTTGALASGNFAANASGTAQDADDFIVYNKTTGVVSYDADGNGAGGAVAFAALTGALTLTSADFLVI